MGRTGVEVRPKSIRLRFALDGEMQAKTLMLNGRPLPPTPANVKHAHRVALEIHERIRCGTFSMAEFFPVAGNGGAGQLTVAEQLETWLGAQRVEHSTRAGYSSAVRFWREAIGQLGLRALRLSHILTALAARPELSGKTVNNYVSVLREAVQLAVADRVLTENPVAGVPRASWQRPEPDPFSLEEVEAILAAGREAWPEPVLNMVEWRFFTGVRTSEMAGLRWPSVNLAAPAHFVVREALVRGQAKDSTKTSTERLVRLNSRALAALERQRRHTQLAGEHVWLDPRYGTPWAEERAFRRSYWTPLLKRLGLRYRAPNEARHTYATMMLMAGRPPAWAAKQMGHSVEMFCRVYTRWIEGAADDRELGALEDWITRSGT